MGNSKDDEIVNLFKGAIDKFDSKEHYFVCEFWADFTVNGQKWKVEKEGYSFPSFFANITGTTAHAEASIQISKRSYKEIREYLDKRLMALNFGAAVKA